MAVGAYLSSFQGVFLFDDNRHIVDNLRIQQLYPLKEVLSGRRPVLDLTLAVNYAIGGLDAWGYHAVNLAVHVLAALTLYGLIGRTMSLPSMRDRFGRASPWLALVPAMIWMAHPLQTQSVTYIVQRGESLMGLFYLLALYCVVRGSQAGSPTSWYASAVVSCAFGMGCKAVMVTAPALVVLFDRLFISKSFGEALRRRWGLYLGLGATLVVPAATGVFQGVLSTAPRAGATVGFAFKDITPVEYLATQAGVIATYLRLALWPAGLCLDYGWPVAKTAGEIAPFVIVVLGLVAATVWALFRKPWLGYLGAWFFLILAPTSSLIPTRDPLFEHRLYLPLAGIVISLVAGATWFLRRLFSNRPLGDTLRRRAGAGLALVVIVGLTFATARRNQVYASRLVMWQDVVRKRPSNARGHNSLGTTLNNLGRFDEAIKSYWIAIRLNPIYADAHFNLGTALLRHGQIDGAIDEFHTTIRLRPQDALAHFNLGYAFYVSGRIEDAISEFHKALEIDPTNGATHVNLGNLFAKLGELDRAAISYRKALSLDPLDLKARFNLANTLRKLGRLEEAVDAYRSALRIDPGFVAAHYNLGNVLAASGNVDQAIHEFRETLRLKPNHAGAQASLRKALSQGGD